METTTEQDNFDVQLREDLQTARSLLLGHDQVLLDFDFYAEVEDRSTELSALNSINQTLCHTYNLLLLMFFFFLSKWLFDKCMVVFSDITRRM